MRNKGASMRLLNKKEEKNEKEAESCAGRKARVAELLQKDVEILESIKILQQKIENMDKNNKKFLMAATMSDGRMEQREQEIANMKMNTIRLLDQIDVLLSAVSSSEAEGLKRGLDSYYSKITEIISEMGLEEITVENNMKFDSKEQECVEAVHLEGYEDDTVVRLLQRGYRDKNSGKIVRCAKVSVNKV